MADFLKQQSSFLFLSALLLLYNPPLEYMGLYKTLIVVIFVVSVLYLRYSLHIRSKDSEG